MLSKVLRTASAFALFMAAADQALAQVQVQVQPGQPATANQGMRAKTILGATVNLQGGMGIGTVQDIVFNDDGVIEYLVVAEGGKLVTVPWEAARFNHAQRTAVINVTPEQFRQIPTYTVNNYPDFYTPAYRTQIYRNYGLTPGRERRVERRDERREGVRP